MLNSAFFCQGWSLQLSSTVDLRSWKLTSKSDKNEKGLGGATIELYQGSTVVKQVRTDPEGDFVIDVPANGEYMLVVSYLTCNPKRFYISTKGVPADIANDNFKPTFGIGGFVMAEAFPGIDYSLLNQPLVRITWVADRKKFDHDAMYTDQMLKGLMAIAKAENDLVEKFTSANKAGDDALRKNDCPLAKTSYEKALGLIPKEIYPRDQLVKVGECLKAKDEAAKKAQEEAEAKAKAEAEAKAKAEADKLAKQKAEAEAKTKAEEERLAKEKAEKEKAEAEKLAKEKAAADKAKAEAEAKAKAEEEKAAKAKSEAGKKEADKLGKEKEAAEKAEAEAKAKTEAKAKADNEKLAKQKAESEAKAKAEAEKKETEKLAKEKDAADKAKADAEAKAKAEEEKLAKQKAANAKKEEKTEPTPNQSSGAATQKKENTGKSEQKSVIVPKTQPGDDNDGASKKKKRKSDHVIRPKL